MNALSMLSVRKVASRLARRLPRHVDIEDLVGAGSLGLADAFARRGGMRGSEFEAFATFRIRGAMLDELRRLDAMPRRSRRSAKRLAIACRAVEQKLGRPAVEEEVAAELGLDVHAYQALRSKIDASRAPLPFSALASDDHDATQDVPDPRNEAPDALAARAQLGAQIARRVGALPERMRTVLNGIYVEGATLKQIGKTLGVSESRICQIHSEALALLRSTFHEDEMSGGADGATGVKSSGELPNSAPCQRLPWRGEDAAASQTRMMAAKRIDSGSHNAAGCRIGRAS